MFLNDREYDLIRTIKTQRSHFLFWNVKSDS